MTVAIDAVVEGLWGSAPFMTHYMLAPLLRAVSRFIMMWDQKASILYYIQSG